MKETQKEEFNSQVFLMAEILKMKMDSILGLYKASLEALPGLGKAGRCNDMFKNFSDSVMVLKDSAIQTIEQFDYMIAMMDGQGEE